jgi:hypothetical protein
MAKLIDEKELSVIVDYHLVGLVDEACDGEAKPPSPHTLGQWFATAPGNIYFESPIPANGARLRLETWDGPADFDATTWDRSDEIVMDLPTGVLGIDQITAGQMAAVYELPHPGRWRIRLAWLDGIATETRPRPEASALVQFWPAEPA